MGNGADNAGGSRNEEEFFPSAPGARTAEVLTERLFEEEPRRSPKREREGLTIDVKPIVAEDAQIIEPEPARVRPTPSKKATREARKAADASISEPPRNPQRAPTRSRKGPSLPYIALEVPGSLARCWQVTPEGVRQVESIPARALAISISGADQRLTTKGTVSDHRGQVLLSEAAFEPVYAINRSRTLKTLYGTSQLRIDSLSHLLSPGILALDLLLRERDLQAAVPVFGWRLKDLEGKDAIVALYHRSASGYVNGPLLSVYPDDLDALIAQFKAAQQVREPAQVALFSSRELLGTTTSLARYPQKPLLGLTSRHLIWLLILFGSISFAAASVKLVHRAQRELTTERAGIALTESRLFGKVGQKLPVFPAARSRHVP